MNEQINQDNNQGINDSGVNRTPSGEQNQEPVRRQDDAKRLMTFETHKKSMGVAYLLWFFLGGFGAHRFYLSETGTAIAMLVICLISIPLAIVGVGFIGLAAIGIWVLVDLFLIPSIARRKNTELMNQLSD